MGMETAFEVFVMFSAVDRISKPMQGIAKDMGMLDKRSEALQKRLAGFKNMMWAGAGITAFGFAMGKGMKSALDAAGELQLALLNVKDTLGLTGAEFRRLQNLTQQVVIPTSFSQIQGAEIENALAQGGLGRKLLNRKILQEYVNFADVRYLSSMHENPAESVAGALSMAHLYQVYDPAKTLKFLNIYNAALSNVHETGAEFATQFGYYGGMARTMKMSMFDAVAAEDFLARNGLARQRGGTNFAQWLRFLLPKVSGIKPKMEATHEAAMKEAGFLTPGGGSVFFHGSHFVGMAKVLELMHHFAAKFNYDATKMAPILNDLFGVQGGRAALTMVGKGSLDIWNNVVTQMKRVASVDKQQAERNANWIGQMKQLETVLHDVWTQFGLALMPQALKFAKTLNKMAAATLDFTQAHPKLMGMAASFAEVAGAAALVVGPTMTLVGGLGYLFESGLIATGIGMVASGFVDLFAAALPLVGVAATIYTAWEHNWGGVRTYVKGVFDDFKTYYLNDTNYAGKMWAKHEQWIKKFGKDARSEFDKNSKHFVKVDNNMTIAWKAFTKTIGQMWTDLMYGMGVGFDALMNHLTERWQTASKFVDHMLKLVGWGAKYYAYPGTQNPMWHPEKYGPPVPTLPAKYDKYMIGGHKVSESAIKKVLTPDGDHWWDFMSHWWYDQNVPAHPPAHPVHRPSSVSLGARVGAMPFQEIHVHEGAIQIHQQPGQDSRDLAREVIRELGTHLRNHSYASPTAVLSRW